MIDVWSFTTKQCLVRSEFNLQQTLSRTADSALPTLKFLELRLKLNNCCAKKQAYKDKKGFVSIRFKARKRALGILILN